MRPTKFFPFAHTALHNLFHPPVTTDYPFAPAQYPERMRGHVEITIEDCISCGLCARSCPPGALTVDRAARSWTINRFDCVQCGNCVQVCPKKCLRILPGYTPPDTAKHSETFTRPGGRRPPGQRPGPVRLLHPLRQKVPPAGHRGGPHRQDLAPGPGRLHRLRRLRRRLPQKVPDDGRGVKLPAGPLKRPHKTAPRRLRLRGAVRLEGPGIRHERRPSLCSAFPGSFGREQAFVGCRCGLGGGFVGGVGGGRGLGCRGCGGVRPGLGGAHQPGDGAAGFFQQIGAHRPGLIHQHGQSTVHFSTVLPL